MIIDVTGIVLIPGNCGNDCPETVEMTVREVGNLRVWIAAATNVII